MTHQKKKMIKRNHKKLSPRSKKITMGAASVLLGAGGDRQETDEPLCERRILWRREEA